MISNYWLVASNYTKKQRVNGNKFTKNKNYRNNRNLKISIYYQLLICAWKTFILETSPASALSSSTSSLFVFKELCEILYNPKYKKRQFKSCLLCPV